MPSFTLLGRSVGYDGVVFWARRGPDGAARHRRSAFTDKYTSERPERARTRRSAAASSECYLACHNGAPSASTAENDVRSRRQRRSAALPEWRRPERIPRARRRSRGALSALRPESACTSPELLPGPRLRRHAVQAVRRSPACETDDYCYGERAAAAAAKSAAATPSIAPILLSTDWQLYKIPFSEFRQVGFGKQAPCLDLKSRPHASRFQFPVGFADVYVDNVSFYRRRIAMETLSKSDESLQSPRGLV